MKPIIEKFYQAFNHLDAEAMDDCYHQNVVFTDPAFGTLYGAKAKNMWRMLCASQKEKDFNLSYSNLKSGPQYGSADWEAQYTFGRTGRKVHNVIHAEFEIEDNKIIRHTDHFDLHRWARQALGVSGLLLGWTPFFKRRLQDQTHRLLEKFETESK